MNLANMILAALVTALLAACGGGNDPAPAAPSPDPIVVTPPPVASVPSGIAIRLYKTVTVVTPGERNTLIGKGAVECETNSWGSCQNGAGAGEMCFDMDVMYVRDSISLTLDGIHADIWYTNRVERKGGGYTYCLRPNSFLDFYRPGTFEVRGDVDPRAVDGAVGKFVLLVATATVEERDIEVSGEVPEVTMKAESIFAPLQLSAGRPWISGDDSAYQDVVVTAICPEKAHNGCEWRHFDLEMWGAFPRSAVYVLVDGYSVDDEWPTFVADDDGELYETVHIHRWMYPGEVITLTITIYTPDGAYVMMKGYEVLYGDKEIIPDTGAGCTVVNVEDCV